MGRAMWQACFIAAVAEPIAKASCCERCTQLGQQESHIGARHVANGSEKFGMERDFQKRARLVLYNIQQVAIDMLPSHADNIATTLAG